MKGVWRMVESVLAIIILMFFLITLGSRVVIGPEKPDVSLRGYDLLRNLDETGELRIHTVNRDYNSINQKLFITGYNHTVEICDYSGSCAGEKPDVENLFVSTYLVSGHTGYEPYVVKLYMW